MAENDVSISAFLELKDKMSGGVKEAAGELDKLGKSADVASAAVGAMSSRHATDAARVVSDTAKMSAGHAAAASSMVSDTAKMSAGFDRAREASGRFVAGARAAGDAAKQAGDAAKDSGESFYAAFLKANLTADAIKGTVTKAVDLATDFASASLELNKTFQDTRRRIAGTLKAFDLAPDMDSAVTKAQTAMETIKNLAATLPGEAQDYLGVFVQGLPKMVEAGMTDMSKAAEFASRYTAVAMDKMVDSAQAANDLFMMLSGTAGADVKTWRVLSAHIGMTTEEFNKLAAATRLDLISEAIEKEAATLPMAAAEYSGAIGEFLDTKNRIIEESGKALMDEFSETVRQITGYLQDNKEELLEIGKALNGVVLGGVRIVVGNFILMQKAVSGVNDLLDFVGDKIRDINDTMGSLFFDVDNLVTRTDEATDAQRRLNEERIQGTQRYNELLREAKTIRDEAKRQEREMAEGDKKRAAQEKTREAIWYRGIEEKLKLTDKVTMGAKIAPYVRQLHELSKKGRISKSEAMAFIESKGGVREVAEDLWRKAEESRRDAKGHKVKAHKAATPKVVQDFRFSKFDIKQEFAEGFDPDRIAVAFATDLSKLGEMRMQSAYAPLFTAR